MYVTMLICKRFINVNQSSTL